jgi:hypothetical protein
MLVYRGKKTMFPMCYYAKECSFQTTNKTLIVKPKNLSDLRQDLREGKITPEKFKLEVNAIGVYPEYG